MTFNIGKHEIGSGRCFIIAEVAQAHNGSFQEALAYIDAVAEAGADAVKFQCHIATEESSPEEPWRVPIPGYESRYAYWQAMEFSPAEWRALNLRAEIQNLEFLCSPFSLKALEMLDPLVPAWKVASGEVTNKPLIEAMVKTGKPILLSSGMTPWKGLSDGIDVAQIGISVPYLIFQSTTEYPCSPEDIGLNIMEDLRYFNMPVGLSDHSGSPYTGLAAVTLGADALEVHVTWDKRQQGPDVSSSLTIDELKVLVEGTRWIERIRNNPVDKDAMAEKLAPTRELFTKSAFAFNRNGPGTNTVYAPGAVLGNGCVVFRKPGTGITPDQWSKYENLPLKRPVTAGQMLSEADFE